MKKLLFASLVLFVVPMSVSHAVVRHVPAEYPSIQRGINACDDGDTVLVSPGVYYETINFGGKNIVVTGTDPNDPKVVGYTIINADEDGTAVTLENRETSQAVLTGFTITGGVGTLSEWSDEYYKEFYGAGIYCANASPTITRNVITKNHGPYSDEVRDGQWYSLYSYGGGICCMGGQPTITHNVIYNNSAFIGGGIYVGYGTVTNNIIYNNSAYYGGGVYISTGYLMNNTVVGNDCSKDPEWGRGGNVYAGFSYYSDLIVANNIIVGAKSGGGMYYGIRPRTDLIRFNDVWNNTPVNYSTSDPRTDERIDGEAADWTGTYGNISVDPLLADLWGNDYHLQATSPCVSAGDPEFMAAQGAQDIDGDPRVFALRVDIGADEHIGYVKPLAHAGVDQHVAAPEPVTLDASDSYFSDPGGVTTYQWRQTEGPAVELGDATAVGPAFTPPVEGWYTFELVVGDDEHTSNPDAVLVVVGNERPIANAGPDGIWPGPGRIRLDGSKSHDADPPDELTFTWTQIDGPAGALLGPGSATPYFNCEAPGIYVFELTVSDGFVTSEPDTVKLEACPFTVDAQGLLNAETYELTSYEQGYFYYPALAGTKAVYAGNEDSQPSSWVIHCLDTKTGIVETFEGSGVDLMPRMDGNLIVWSGGSGTYYTPMCTSVFLADLATGKTHHLRMGSATDSYGYPAISGNKVVWLQHLGVDTQNEARYQEASYDICGADITNPARPVYFTIAEQVGRRPPYPYDNYSRAYDDVIDIDGDIVVWEGNGDIFGADLSDLSDINVFPICTAPERQYDPAVSGRRVVWTDERNDIGDIYAADISDPHNIREFEVWAGPGWQLQPDIDGALIAFVDGDDYSGQIRSCCISRGYGPVHFSLPGYYFYYGARPQVDGTTIVWHRGSRVEGVSLEFAYAVTDGPIQNVTTAERYDYIQHAISAAGDGEVILVPEGTHDEKLRFKGKRITVTSADPQDPAVRANTVIAGTGQLVTFAENEENEALLTGFTISGGSYGVYCSGSSPTVADCTMTGNTYAGIKLWNEANPLIANCAITANGTGVEMWTPGGIRFMGRNDITLRNCLIAGNRKDGIWGDRPTIENCTIADNLGYGLTCVLANVTNSILYFNHPGDDNVKLQTASSTVTYSDIQGGWPGQGNIDADPLFVGSGYWSDSTGMWIPGDYHLKSEGWSWDAQQQAWTWDDVTSPCIDAGDPGLSLGDEPPCALGDPLSERAINTRINMGAYGGTAEASSAPHGWSP